MFNETSSHNLYKKHACPGSCTNEYREGVERGHMGQRWVEMRSRWVELGYTWITITRRVYRGRVYQAPVAREGVELPGGYGPPGLSV